MKPGWKTTEFWATVLFNVGSVASAASGVVPPKFAAFVSAVSVAAYAIARGLAKKNGSD